MTVAERMRQKLAGALQPLRLELRDDSHRHAGHVGARPEGETHFHLHVVSEAFTGKSRVERQRMVNEILAEELAGPVHALSMKAISPGEWDGQN